MPSSRADILHASAGAGGGGGGSAGATSRKAAPGAAKEAHSPKRAHPGSARAAVASGTVVDMDDDFLPGVWADGSDDDDSAADGERR